MSFLKQSNLIQLLHYQTKTNGSIINLKNLENMEQKTICICREFLEFKQRFFQKIDEINFVFDVLNPLKQQTQFMITQQKEFRNNKLKEIEFNKCDLKGQKTALFSRKSGQF